MQLSIFTDLVLGLVIFTTFTIANLVTLGLFWSFMSFENYDRHLIRHCIEQPKVIPVYLVGWLTYMMIPASVVVGYGSVLGELSAFDLLIVSLTPGLIVVSRPVQ